MTDKELWDVMAGSMMEVIASKEHGEKWVEQAVPELISLAREEKEIEAEKEKEIREKKTAYDNANKPFLARLKEIKLISDLLRERLKAEYTGTDTILDERLKAEVVFPMVWGFEIKDLAKVPRQFLTINDKLVNEEIKKGIRKIPGLEIKQFKRVEVRTKLAETTDETQSE